MKNIYLIAVGFTFFSTSCQQKEILSREEVIAVIEKFDAGWKNKNAAVVDAVLSPSYIYFTQSGGIFDRKNIIQTAGSSDYRLDTFQRQQLDIKIDGNTAIVNTIWNGKGSYFGSSFDERQRCSITIIKKNGKAEILSEHCTLIK
jgi:Domain of unknown function (DUF4440)